MPWPAFALCVWHASPVRKTRGARVARRRSTSSNLSVTRWPTSYTLCQATCFTSIEYGMQDLVRLADDLLDRRLAHAVVVVRRDLAEVDVHAAEVAALARDVQDVARLGVDRALGAPVGEVGVDEHVHDAPRVRGELADVLASDRLAHAAAGAVAADDVLRPHGALLPGARARSSAAPGPRPGTRPSSWTVSPTNSTP